MKPLNILFAFLLLTAAARAETTYNFSPPTAAGGLTCLSIEMTEPQKLAPKTCDAACAAVGSLCITAFIPNNAKTLRCDTPITAPKTTCRCCKVAP